MRPNADASALGRALAPHTVRAHNFAEQSSNKIHSDEVAGKLGYRGGLVPGVSLFAYMTVPVVRELGADWLARGHMTGKFIAPIYHGERVRVTAQVTSESPLHVELNLFNQQDELCAVGTATLPDAHPTVDARRYPRVPMPSQKFPARVAGLPANTPLGSLEIDKSGAAYSGEFKSLLEEVRESLPIYSGPGAPWHPALMPMRANRLLAENVDLGPWIHTASDVRYHALPRPGETVWMSGHVAESYTKRGHEIVSLDLAVLGANDRVLSQMTHTAIIRPAQLTA